MKRIVLIILIILSQSITAQDTHYQGVRVKNTTDSDNSDNIVTIDNNGLIKKSLAVFGDVAFLINNQTFTGNNTFTGTTTNLNSTNTNVNGTFAITGTGTLNGSEIITAATSNFVPYTGATQNVKYR